MRRAYSQPAAKRGKRKVPKEPGYHDNCVDKRGEPTVNPIPGHMKHARAYCKQDVFYRLSELAYLKQENDKMAENADVTKLDDATQEELHVRFARFLHHQNLCEDRRHYNREKLEHELHDVRPFSLPPKSKKIMDRLIHNYAPPHQIEWVKEEDGRFAKKHWRMTNVDRHRHEEKATVSINFS